MISVSPGCCWEGRRRARASAARNKIWETKRNKAVSCVTAADTFSLISPRRSGNLDPCLEAAGAAGSGNLEHRFMFTWVHPSLCEIRLIESCSLSSRLFLFGVFVFFVSLLWIRFDSGSPADTLTVFSSSPASSSFLSSCELFWSFGFFLSGIFKSTCYIDVRWFPFDVQRCDLKFGSWTYGGWTLDLQMIEADITGYIANGEWDLVGKRPRV